jgi:putative FmdB family regulatory protein
MPLYEYECDSCHHRFELIQRFSDPLAHACPECGGPVKKLLSSPAIQFKGSGWYITDYARKGGTDAGAQTPKDPAKPAETPSSGGSSSTPAAPSTTSGTTDSKGKD